jgi:DNA-binding NtrC family response regulator
VRTDTKYVMHTTALVVDDNRDSRVILRTWLRHWGLKVRQARNATEALEEMGARAPDIVFLDILMPDHDGLWLAKRIHQRWPHTGIVMASCVTDMKTAARAQALGAIDYLVKPFGRELLHQAVERAIALSAR